MTSGHDDFKTAVILRGVFSGEQVSLAVDASGRLRVQRIEAGEISADTTEAVSWDAPVLTLINSLNRIRYAIVTMSGEAWGTFSHSIATLWGKFNTSTGHAHSWTANDGKPVYHGDCVGLGNDDHALYTLVSGNRAFTGHQSMGMNRLTNLLWPVDYFDAATKQYVDDATGGGATMGDVMVWAMLMEGT